MTGAIANHVWQSTLFAGAAALLTIAFRHNRAGVRYWLWFSASAKFLLPFWLLISLGSYWRWERAVRPIAAADVSFTVAEISQPFGGTAPAARNPRDWVPMAVLCAWACGFLGVALMRLRGWQQIRAAMRSSTAMRIRHAVEVRTSGGLLEPGVVGLWKPILLLPAGIEERLTPSQLEAVLAHELCHVRRRDNLRAAVHMVVEAVFWFHPLVWWIGARLVEERERACDEGVLMLGSAPRDYAEAIVSVCKLYAESPLRCVPGVTGADIKKRIEVIMTNRTGVGLNRAKKFLLAGAGVAALAGPIFMGGLIRVGSVPAIHAAPASAAQQAPADPNQNRRLIAMLFDLDSITAEEQSRAQQAAMEFVRGKMQAADRVAVMASKNGKVAVENDFTDDQTVLEATIMKLGALEGNIAVPGPGGRLSGLETAARMLGAIPGKKTLMYFSSAAEQPVVYGQAELQEAIDTAKRANVAFHPVAVPIATYEGEPGVAATLVEALSREGQTSGRAPAADAIAGLPGRHASFQIYAEKDRFSPRHRHAALLVPLDSFSGHVDVLGEVLAETAGSDTAVNHVRDTIPVSQRTFQADFMLGPRSYVCHLVVREQESGRTYGETIRLDVP